MPSKVQCCAPCTVYTNRKMLRQINGLAIEVLNPIAGCWKIYQVCRRRRGFALAVPGCGPYVVGEAKRVPQPTPGTEYDGNRCPPKSRAAG
jgi:hypothetical protein